MIYLLHLLAMIAIHATLAQAAGLALGYGGMLSLCTSAFAGIGAYSMAILTMRAGAPFWIAVSASALLAAIIATLVGYLAQRLRGDFFVMATMGVQAVVTAVLANWTGLTGGVAGIVGIPRPISDGRGLAMLLAGGSIAIAIFVSALSRSAFGTALQAVRDDTLAARAIGLRPEYFRGMAFGIAGGLAALAGSMYAVQITYIDPTSFGIGESVLVLTMVILGGSGSTTGPFVGAALLVITPEVLRLLGVPDALAANLRQVLYGCLLILMMFLRPRGFLGTYALD